MKKITKKKLKLNEGLELLKSGSIKLFVKLKNFNVENFKLSSTLSNCKKRTRSFLPNQDRQALTLPLRTCRYKKAIRRNLKAELKPRLMLLNEIFKKLMSLEILKQWQRLNSLLPEPRPIVLLYHNTSVSLQSIKKTTKNGLKVRLTTKNQSIRFLIIIIKNLNRST